MSPALDYRSCTAVVTGASGGIGEAMARELAGRGARVALVARRRERLDALARQIAEAGGEAAVFPCDVSDASAVAIAADEIVRTWGGFDLLVNNAGYVRHVLFKDHELDDIERMMRTNYLGTVAWMKHAVPIMRSRGKGWIVNLSSFAGVLPQVDEAAYSATKAAVTAISEAASHELAPLGIRVMAVHPVLVRSEMFTDEVLARMPRGSENTFIEADDFCRRLLRALEDGETSVVIPSKFRFVPKLKALFPKTIGRAVARSRLAALPDVTD
jgi:short-subunit dehydrogenase